MSELKPVLVPEELQQALAAEAANEGVSLEALTADAVTAHLEALRTRRFFEAHARTADPEWLMQFLNRKSGAPRSGDELPEGYRPA